MAVLRRLRAPLLAVFGAADLLVDAEASAAAIEAELARAGHPDHDVVVFPGADHGIRVPTGPGVPRVEQGHWTPGAPAPGLFELLTTWLAHRLRPARR